MEKMLKDFPDYSVDEQGNVYSYKTGKKHKMSPYLDGKKRYRMIDLMVNGIKKKCLIHRLVAQTFIPNPNNLPEVDHIDNNPQNNNVENLQWCDRKFNLTKSYKTLSPVRNYKITALYNKNVLVGYFKSTKLACKYAVQHFDCSFTSLEKYKYSKDISITHPDVTTIENLRIIENLEEVE